MRRPWIGALWSLFLCLSPGAVNATLTTPVEFESKETFEGASGIEPGSVTGLLTVPDGDGPFPVVLVLHGCAGPTASHEEWAGHFASWGYASLRIDSFGPRGIDEICTNILRPVPRVADVNGAIDFLETLDHINTDRVAVVGFSHGANVTLLVAGEPGSLAPRHKPSIKAAVAVYPYCPMTHQRFAPPLMILIGSADDWTPASRCESLVEGSTAAEMPIDLIVYDGATHSYDCRACNGEYWGYQLIHNPAAHDDSIQRMHDFLLAHLGPGVSATLQTATASSASTPLDAAAIEGALTGSTTMGVNSYGNPYTVRILDDGTTAGVAGHHDEFVDSGSWWIEDDMYCRRWNTWLDGATGCFHVVIEGDKVRWLNADGSLARQEDYIAPE